MKTIVHSTRSRDRLLHIETDGCIVNIQVGLTNQYGQDVTLVEVLPNTSENWRLVGSINNRVVHGPQTQQEVDDDIAEAVRLTA